MAGSESEIYGDGEMKAGKIELGYEETPEDTDSEPEVNHGEIDASIIEQNSDGYKETPEVADSEPGEINGEIKAGYEETPDYADSEPEVNNCDGEIKACKTEQSTDGLNCDSQETKYAGDIEQSEKPDEAERIFDAISKRFVDNTRETPDDLGIKQTSDGYKINRMLKDERMESWNRVLNQWNLTLRDAIPPCQAFIANAKSQRSQERRRTTEALEANRIRSKMGTQIWETEVNTAVSLEAQRIFEALSKRYLVQWDGTHILVARQVSIHSPYHLDCVVGRPERLNGDVKELLKLATLETKGDLI